MNGSRFCALLAGGLISAIGPAHGRVLDIAATPRPAVPGRVVAARPAPDAAPIRLADYWWVPGPSDAERRGSPAAAGFARGVDLIENGRFADGLALVSNPALSKTPLAGYAAYYTAVAELQLGRAQQARARLDGLRRTEPGGALQGLTLVRAAEAAVAAGDPASAAALYGEALALRPNGETEALLTALAPAASAAGLSEQAADAWMRLYAEFPTSDGAETAQDELGTRPEWGVLAPGSRRLALEQARADRLFAAGRFEKAREGYDLLARAAGGAEAARATMRRAQCDFRLRRYHAAREAFAAFADAGPNRAEARYHLAATTRALGEIAPYLEMVSGLVADEPASPWAEEALNDLGTHHILADEDAEAAAVFADLWRRFPTGRHAPRAAWKAAWWAYRQGQFDEAGGICAAAAQAHPGSDYRPSWTYWLARARERAGRGELARTAYEAVLADYRFTFYGDQALKALGPSVRPRGPVPRPAPPVRATPPATLPLIRTLIGLELYGLAEGELEQVRRSSGDSPALLATLAYVVGEQGDPRRAIILMRRAYPDHLRAVDTLPREIQRVIYPLDYWPLIRKYAASRRLDPFLVAALINQESTFVADIKSRANAIGLMQVLPATGRRYARQLGIRRFSALSLTRPEINLRIGTAYFSDLVKRFGKSSLALAAYNAGESRVQAWLPERRGLDEDEFIDDIPFPETQGYVRKVLGMAGEYRRVYGDQRTTAPAPGAKTPAPAPKRRVPAPKTPARSREPGP